MNTLREITDKALITALKDAELGKMFEFHTADHQIIYLERVALGFRFGKNFVDAPVMYVDDAADAFNALRFLASVIAIE